MQQSNLKFEKLHSEAAELKTYKLLQFGFSRNKERALAKKRSDSMFFHALKFSLRLKLILHKIAIGHKG